MATTPLQITARVAAAVAGGYAFTWGFAALGLALLLWFGSPFDEARTAVYLLAFLVFLTVFCWAFAVRRLRQVWWVLAGGGAAMSAAAWLLSRALL